MAKHSYKTPCLISFHVTACQFALEASACPVSTCFSPAWLVPPPGPPPARPGVVVLRGGGGGGGSADARLTLGTPTPTLPARCRPVHGTDPEDMDPAPQTPQNMNLLPHSSFSCAPWVHSSEAGSHTFNKDSRSLRRTTKCFPFLSNEKWKWLALLAKEPRVRSLGPRC